jgi:type II secretion system protein N
MSAGLTGLTGRFARLVPRRLPSRNFAGYAAWTIAWFVVFLTFTFPHDLVVRRWTEDLATQSGWQLRYDDVWLRPWSGYHLAQARLIAPGKDLEPWLAAADVAVSPSLSFFYGGGGFPLSFSGTAYGGEFSGSLDASGALDLTWSGAHVADYPRLTKLIEGTWNGDLSGELHVAGKTDLKNVEGRGKLGLKNGALTQAKAQGFTIPDLHFASGEAEFELKGGRLDVRTLKLSGSEVDADVHGQVYLGNPTAMPVVNATLGLKPIPGAPPGIDALLQLWNRNQRPPGGVYNFTLSGPLNALRVR